MKWMGGHGDEDGCEMDGGHSRGVKQTLETLFLWKLMNREAVR